jgi:hypothetical protein
MEMEAKKAALPLAEACMMRCHRLQMPLNAITRRF